MDQKELTKIVETLLYMTDHPIPLSEIKAVVDLKSISDDEIKASIKEISDRYDNQESALRVVEVAGGYQMSTRRDMAVWIRRMYKERLTVRLSQSGLETLSIIAYKQPITRSEIEQIRGVEVSGVMETLLERRLIKVVGRKETIGRPLLYGTTADFLRNFGLKHLSELPDLNSFTLPTTPSVEQVSQEELLPLEPIAVPVSSEGSETTVPAIIEE